MNPLWRLLLKLLWRLLLKILWRLLLKTLFGDSSEDLWRPFWSFSEDFFEAFLKTFFEDAYGDFFWRRLWRPFLKTPMETFFEDAYGDLFWRQVSNKVSNSGLQIRSSNNLKTFEDFHLKTGPRLQMSSNVFKCLSLQIVFKFSS